MKIWKIIKGILYTAMAVVIIVFAKQLWVEEIKYLVGGLMLIYGIPEVIIFIVKRKSFKDHTNFFWATIEIILGIIVIFFVKDVNEDGTIVSGYSIICVIWAIWSILREALEIEEGVREILHHKPGVLSIIESLVVIYFSIGLLREPGEHHVLIHCYYILPIELISSGILWPLLEYLFEKKIHKNLINEHHE